MLTVTMTPHLLGFAVTGDYDELNNLYDAVHTLVGDLDDGALSMGEAIARERLLALCYDLRHASMGNRSVRMIDNGMDRDKAEWLDAWDFASEDTLVVWGTYTTAQSNVAPERTR